MWIILYHTKTNSSRLRVFKVFASSAERAVFGLVSSLNFKMLKLDSIDGVYAVKLSVPKEQIQGLISDAT